MSSIGKAGFTVSTELRHEWDLSKQRTFELTSPTFFLDVGQSAQFTFEVPPVFSAVRATSQNGTWVRLYRSEAARSADAARSLSDDPPVGHGVLLETYHLPPQLTINLAPPPLCVVEFSGNSTLLWCRLTNRGTAAQNTSLVLVGYRLGS